MSERFIAESVGNEVDIDEKCLGEVVRSDIVWRVKTGKHKEI